MNNNLQALLATNKDFPYVEKIWKECFVDVDSAYSSHLLLNMLNKSKCFVLKNNSKQILSTLVLSPVKYYDQSTNKTKSLANGYYLTFVATPSQHRGNNYFHYLFNQVIQTIEKCDFIITRPASDGIAELYKKEQFSKTIKTFPSPLTIKNNFPKFSQQGGFFTFESFEEELLRYYSKKFEAFSEQDFVEYSKIIEKKIKNHFSTIFLWSDMVFILKDAMLNSSTALNLFYVEKMSEKFEEPIFLFSIE